MFSSPKSFAPRSRLTSQVSPVHGNNGEQRSLYRHLRKGDRKTSTWSRCWCLCMAFFLSCFFFCGVLWTVPGWDGCWGEMLEISEVSPFPCRVPGLSLTARHEEKARGSPEKGYRLSPSKSYLPSKYIIIFYSPLRPTSPYLPIHQNPRQG